MSDRESTANASGTPGPPPPPLRDRTPFSKGERMGYGLAAALGCAAPLALLWGDHAWDACTADVLADGGEPDLCGIAMGLAILTAVVVVILGLVVFGITAWRRARRLRRLRPAPGTGDG